MSIVDEMTEFQKGQLDALKLIAAAAYGKECYFFQDNDVVYSRISCTYMTLDDAINELREYVSEDYWL